MVEPPGSFQVEEDESINMIRFLRRFFSGRCTKCGGKFTHLDHPLSPAVCENCSPEIAAWRKKNAYYPIDPEIATRRAKRAMERFWAEELGKL